MKRYIFPFAFCFVLLGCDDDGEHPPGLDGAAAVDNGAVDGGISMHDQLVRSEGLDRFAEALCRFFKRFESTTGRVIAGVGSCKAQWMASAACDDNLAQAAESAFGTCAAWLDKAKAYDDINHPNPCSKLFGLAAEGERCVLLPNGGQKKIICGPGLFCRFGSKAGECAVCKRAGQQGEACKIAFGQPGHMPCAWGLYCDKAKGKCLVPRAAGDSCLADEECQTIYCKGGKCTARAAEGGGCTSSSDCAKAYPFGFQVCIGGKCSNAGLPGAACQNDSHCLSSKGQGQSYKEAFHYCLEGKCKAATPCKKREEDQPCTWSGDCDEGLYCAFPAVVCTKTLPLGSKCQLVDACGPKAYCGGNPLTCQQAIAIGGKCSGTPPCVEGAWCDDGTCRAKAKEGDACTSGSGCLSGFCDGTSKKCTDGPSCTMS